MEKKDLKIVFFGTPDFAVASLEKLVDNGFNIVGVVTMPDKIAGRGHKMIQSAVKQCAVAHGLHLMQPEKLKSPEFLAELSSLGADLFIVIAFRMLPREVWQMPKLGTFNLHASLLPKYRGAAPINWAIINGDTETGVTTFFLKHEIDTGDIIRQEKIDILPEDNVGTVHDKLMELGADLTLDTVQSIITGNLATIPQDQLIGDQQPTPAPKIFTDDCRIDWKKSNVEIHNLVRGLSPYPAAWTIVDQTSGESMPLKLKIYETKPMSGGDNICQPGRVTIANDKLLVDCGTGRIEILSLQPEGKKRMNTSDFLRGFRMQSPKML